MKDEAAMKTLEATAIRRRLKTLNSELGKGTKLTQNRVEKIKKEINELQQKSNSLNKENKSKTYRKSLGNCINPNCRKRIVVGQTVIKFGHLGLCCNYKCLSIVMNGS